MLVITLSVKVGGYSCDEYNLIVKPCPHQHLKVCMWSSCSSLMNMINPWSP